LVAALHGGKTLCCTFLSMRQRRNGKCQPGLRLNARMYVSRAS
jgi:hypothetical protein